MTELLPRSAPAARSIDAAGVLAVLDRLEQRAVECHSLMVVRGGHVVAEGWWAPYTAERRQLLYSVTKSFTGIAVGLAVEDGLLALDDRIVDVLPERVPDELPQRCGHLTVHHLLSMSTGHRDDPLETAWTAEPTDLVRGLLRTEPEDPVGSRHAYNNAAGFVLARMVERVTGRSLPDLLDERLLGPIGIRGAEWDRVASGRTFGFHGLYLTTEAVAAFGELLLRGGEWHGRQLVPRHWLERATRPQIETLQFDDGTRAPDWLCGYGYHFWMSRHGYRADGAMGQLCVVVPESDLVVAITAATTDTQALLDALWDQLLPAVDRTVDHDRDQVLASRLRQLALPIVTGEHRPGHEVRAVVAATHDSALPPGASILIDPRTDGWSLRIETDSTAFELAVGHGEWRESSPLGRPVVAAGGWQDDTFVVDLLVITSPSRVRIVVTGSQATAAWNIAPLVGPDLLRQLRAGLITRPDRA